jgi:hypothetical protein
VGGVLSEDGISLWAMAYSHSTFWGSLGDRETHTGTIFPAPIVEFLAGTRAHTPTSGDLSPRYSAEMLCGYDLAGHGHGGPANVLPAVSGMKRGVSSVLP